MNHCLGISKHFTAQRENTPQQYWSLEQLNVFNVITITITINYLIYLIIYILKHRVRHFLVWNNAPALIRKPPHNRRVSPKIWHLIWSVFYDIFAILISAFCWFFKHMKCKKMHDMHNIKFKHVFKTTQKNLVVFLQS